jgi:hypothetical protein
MGPSLDLSIQIPISLFVLVVVIAAVVGIVWDALHG